MPRNLKKRGRIWWFKITKAGKDHEGSLHTENLGTAKERLAVARERLTNTDWGKKPRRTFDEAAVEFGKQHFDNLKPRSAEQYLVSIANLLTDFTGVYLDDIGSARLSGFELRRRREGVTGSTIRRDLACLSVIMTLAEQWEWVARNPVKPFLRGRRLAGLEENDARTRWLTIQEEAEVLTAAAPKAMAGIIFAIDTGLRKEEQFSAVWDWVDLTRRQIVVPKEFTKSGKSRVVPLLDRTHQLLKAMPRHVKAPYIFHTAAGRRYSVTSPTMYEALQRAIFRANKARGTGKPMLRASWHDLRRTCGCRLLQDHKLTMEEVSRWLGHSSVKVTEQHYAFLSPEQLHQAVRRSEGK